MNAEKVTNHIVHWLKTYAENAKVKGFVIGISGGIDSAVVSTLCAETGVPTLCLELPIHQAENHVSRAKEHIAFLKEKYSNITDLQVDLTPVFDQFVKQIPTTDQHSYEMALANTRSRLRMTTLYYFAGLDGRLVVGTGNKIEDFGVGFFTKYGDGGVDISPIADLMKSEVYQLARYLGVPESIVMAKPSDGLFGDDRSDEDQLKANYDELEWAMLQHENGKTTEDFSGRQKEVFEIYQRLNRANQHKMNPIPICKVENSVKKG
ncbi:NH(3)-dependent NAD(+) synthetase [Capnocytophaga canis]|uniref:NH(3)-dependent NAD(+) synthetase n=1 Tax=Capnocytophaga canis TaxID=1848903 RepID=A0A0B7IP16_9FLAO|nr:NAD(+) synthase [Capnocytophaga canis]CEN43138.1 NH(3)-dependent NAD(+) synthetase [Capnocytophaga canis]CEN44624.1 NH(3)-dependent NAD(+) synthetase [Capnocytophaga canis]CEN51703.1 NH(3)-dependent NAD(+) synthetase [Capnocytophaga canis]